jgi:hypothetical protein
MTCNKCGERWCAGGVFHDVYWSVIDLRHDMMLWFWGTLLRMLCTDDEIAGYEKRYICEMNEQAKT